jgi:hypothetical protein
MYFRIKGKRGKIRFVPVHPVYCVFTIDPAGVS